MASHVWTHSWLGQWAGPPLGLAISPTLLLVSDSCQGQSTWNEFNPSTSQCLLEWPDWHRDLSSRPCWRPGALADSQEEAAGREDKENSISILLLVPCFQSRCLQIDQGEAGGPQASGLENHTLLIPSPPESCLSHQVPFWFTIQSPSPSGTSAPHLSLTSTCSGMHERLNTWTMCIHRHVPRPVYICSYGGVDFQKSFPYHSRSQPLGH